ncbi:MAG: hypothetical protein AABX14_05020 [Candidatus Aenigmatarchaeota archaeon]
MKDPLKFEDGDFSSEFGIYKIRRDMQRMSYWYELLEDAEKRMSAIKSHLKDAEEMTEPEYLIAAITCISRARTAMQRYPDDPKIRAYAERIEGVYSSIDAFSGFRE